MTAIYNHTPFPNPAFPTAVSSNVVNFTNVTLPTPHILPIPTPNVTLVHPFSFTTFAPRVTARAPDAIETPDATDATDNAPETITDGLMSTTVSSTPLVQLLSELIIYPPGFVPHKSYNPPYRPWPSYNPHLLSARSVAAPAPTASVATTKALKSEYWGFPLTWVTSTKYIYDRPQKGAVAGAAGAADTVMDEVNTSAEDTDFDALLAAAWLIVEMPTPTMPSMPGLTVPSTFATIIRASSASSPANPAPAATAVAPADIHKRQGKFYLTLTATYWKTVHFGAPFTITQTDTVTLETGMVMPPGTSKGVPVVTVGGEW